jgi:hypothetical protein
MSFSPPSSTARSEEDYDQSAGDSKPLLERGPRASGVDSEPSGGYRRYAARGLMIRYRAGVQVKQSYEVVEVDEDYFE